MKLSLMRTINAILVLSNILSVFGHEQITFEERLKKASQEGAAAVERGAKGVSEKVAEQSAVTAEKIRITVDNIRRAFEGQPLKPLYNDIYLRAVYATKQEGNISDQAPLIPIVPWNNDLIWSDPQKLRVLMVSWMPRWAVERFYRPYLGKAFQTSTMPGVYIWATAVPELKQFAQNYLKNPAPQMSLSERLKQFLGLPESKEEYFFVELWVRPQDIFRPCINTDIISNVCLPDPNPNKLPVSYKNIIDFVPNDPNYKQWYINRKNVTYSGDHPFPWTRLGYTYDWGNREPRKIGASEFVIKQGSTVFIHSITPTNEYPLLATPEGK